MLKQHWVTSYQRKCGSCRHWQRFRARLVSPLATALICNQCELPLIHEDTKLWNGFRTRIKQEFSFSRKNIGGDLDSVVVSWTFEESPLDFFKLKIIGREESDDYIAVEQIDKYTTNKYITTKTFKTAAKLWIWAFAKTATLGQKPSFSAETAVVTYLPTTYILDIALICDQCEL